MYPSEYALLLPGQQSSRCSPGLVAFLFGEQGLLMVVVLATVRAGAHVRQAAVTFCSSCVKGNFTHFFSALFFIASRWLHGIGNGGNLHTTDISKNYESGILPHSPSQGADLPMTHGPQQVYKLAGGFCLIPSIMERAMLCTHGDSYSFTCGFAFPARWHANIITVILENALSITGIMHMCHILLWRNVTMDSCKLLVL